MFGLGSIIPLKTGLKIVAGEIENQVGFSVSRFEIIMNVEKDTLDFKVWKPDNSTEMYNYPHALIKDTIKSVSEQQLSTNEKMHYAVVHYDSNENVECYALIYFQDENGEKKQLKHII